MCHAAGQVKVKAAGLVTGLLQVQGRARRCCARAHPASDHRGDGRMHRIRHMDACDGLLEEVLVDLDDVNGALDLDADAVADHQASETGAVDEDDTGGD